MEAISVTPMEIEIPKLRPLLRRGKYYVKATNGACAKCERGIHGCCEPHLRFRKVDFRMDFTSIEEVRDLIETGVFGIRLSLSPDTYYEASATIYIKGRNDAKEKVCIFWADKGCRLAYAVRPEVCRTHSCYAIRHKHEYAEFNARDKKRSSYSRRGNDFTKAEVKTMFQVLLDFDNEYDMEENEYRRLDWDSILTVLQGKP